MSSKAKYKQVTDKSEQQGLIPCGKYQAGNPFYTYNGGNMWVEVNENYKKWYASFAAGKASNTVIK